MKLLSSGIALASLCLLLSSCSKQDNIFQEEASLTLPEETLFKSVSPNSLARHKPVLFKAEYMKCSRSKDDAQTIMYNDRKTRPDAEFVGRDPRRGGTRVLTYAIGKEITRDFGVSRNAVSNAIERAMYTWSNVSCTRLIMKKIQNSDKLGYVSGLLGFGGYEGNIADITHAGFLGKEFFNTLTPGGGDFVLAVTFTFIFFDENGLPTDIDGNGVNDVAFRETYYNDNFKWRTNNYCNTDYDIESVALHETGHALGLSHFGKGVLQKDGKIRFTPRAVMNAVYIGPLRQPQSQDKSFECSIWKNWNK